MTTETHALLSADTLVGDDVVNSKGEKLGSLKSIMLDSDHGRIAYGVLSFGGFLGMGDKLFAIPWSALRINRKDKCCVFDVDKKKLEKAAGFDKSEWPDFANADWNTETYKYWGQKPYWA